jgi:copper homeostasis protein
MLLEVIATTLQDAERAEAGGADRIELVADLRQGGLTPDMALVKQISAAVKLPVHVMIRPHARAFQMSKVDITNMVTSIQQAEQAGASALVWGVLTPEREIDQQAVEVLLAASALPVTFHRAFDDMKHQIEALHRLLAYKQIRSVLTSGGAASVLQAVTQITKLASIVKSHPLYILAGGGLTLESLESFVLATRVRAVHLGTGVRTNSSADEPVAVEKVRKARTILDELVRTSL